MALQHRPAYWTCDDEGHRAYYFAPTERASPPYRTQREVTAILDIASDGTLAGVELVMGELPPPPLCSQPAPLGEEELRRIICEHDEATKQCSCAHGKYLNGVGWCPSVCSIASAILVRLQPAPVVPEGYKLVPVEPTEAMEHAGQVPLAAAMIDAITHDADGPANIYRAMLAAAPPTSDDNATSAGEL